MKRPLGLAYWLDERPPMGVTLLSGLQHLGLVSIFLLVPVLACREAGLSPDKTLDVLALSMIVLAIGPVVQQLGRRGVGCGYLCPTIFAAPYLPASVMALKAGGLPLMFGMTVFAGLVEIGVSRLLKPLRPYFPPELAGLVVVMIGVTIGVLGFRSIAGAAAASTAGWSYAIAAVTLGTMVALNVWTKGASKLFCALIGMVVGYAMAAATGELRWAELERLGSVSLVRLPDVSHLGWSFDAGLVVPFAIAAVAASLRAMGDVTVCQKTNDAEWTRPDMGSISGGALANGICTMLSGLLGTVGTNTSTSNIGLAAATGVTSRRVAFSLGGSYLALAFLPVAGIVFVLMPGAVVGATLVFASCLVFINGLLIITARMLDARRTFVIGLSFMLGLSVDVLPGAFAALPPNVRIFAGSSLLLATLAALVLNFVFRVGVRRKVSMTVDPAAIDTTALERFIIEHGAAWGARRDVIERAEFCLLQSTETIASSGIARGPLEIAASFDEFSVDLTVAYDGEALDLPVTRPNFNDILDAADGEHRLAGFLLRRLGDRVTATHKGDRTTLLFHFDH